jgi:glutamine amidotransferase
MKVVIIDYDAGNVESVFNALTLLCDESQIVISNKILDLRSATHIILPGVGAFGDCMSNLKAIEGLISEMRNQILVEKKPFLGVCVGMQALANKGLEDGIHEGLGLIDGVVEKITTPQGSSLKVPHMGWNNVAIKPNNHPILEGIKDGEHFYFANSYYFNCPNESEILGEYEYAGKRSAILAKDNIFAAQFHPEKSGAAGLKILENFLNWRV